MSFEAILIRAGENADLTFLPEHFMTAAYRRCRLKPIKFINVKKKNMNE